MHVIEPTTKDEIKIMKTATAALGRTGVGSITVSRTIAITARIGTRGTMSSMSKRSKMRKRGLS